MVEVLRWGYCIPFARVPSLSQEPIPIPSYAPMSTKGVALEEVPRALISKGAVELAPLPSLGFYSHLLWCGRPRFLASSHRPLSSQSFSGFLSLQDEDHPVYFSLGSSGDWMVSINLKEAYLQIPVHPESRKYLRFVAFSRVYQFRVLCFGLASAPQVFTCVMAPVSSILYSVFVFVAI